MQYFFTSDTHFGDDDKLQRENWITKDWQKFAKKLIKIWNKQVKKDDLIYFLGDYVNYEKTDNQWREAFALIKKIKAKCILIVGNNEERLIEDKFNGSFNKFRQFCLEQGFTDVKKHDILKSEGLKFYLTHKPTDYKKGYINLFGHTHLATGLWKPFGFNVYYGLNFLKLFDLDYIKRLLYVKQKYWDEDENNWFMGEEK